MQYYWIIWREKNQEEKVDIAKQNMLFTNKYVFHPGSHIQENDGKIEWIENTNYSSNYYLFSDLKTLFQNKRFVTNVDVEFETDAYFVVLAESMWKVSKYYRTVGISASLLKETMLKNKIYFYLKFGDFFIASPEFFIPVVSYLLNY